jgi:hypothetical protein
MIRVFLHGTSTSLLTLIRQYGIKPSCVTGLRAERRKRNLDKVFLLSDLTENESQAKVYAERAAMKFGGDPVILRVGVPVSRITLERTGRFVQYSTTYVEPNEIIGEQRL